MSKPLVLVSRRRQHSSKEGSIRIANGEIVRNKKNCKVPRKVLTIHPVVVDAAASATSKALPSRNCSSCFGQMVECIVSSPEELGSITILSDLLDIASSHHLLADTNSFFLADDRGIVKKPFNCSLSVKCVLVDVVVVLLILDLDSIAEIWCGMNSVASPRAGRV